MATATATGKNVGRITQVIGSTFDAQFEEDHLPAIYNAVRIQSEHKGVKIDLTGEVQQHLGGREPVKVVFVPGKLINLVVR